MKPLHSSTWRTESDCGVLVDVAEGRTTEWAPFREIVVTMDAGMTPAEARRLIADLQHAIALAEEQPAVSEDQPKPREPRVWHKGDAEPPADVTELLTAAGNRVVRVPGGWCMPHCHPDGDQRLCSPALASDWEGVTVWDNPLSEVLADSEQVTR